MYSLKEGVLLKLVEEMKRNGDGGETESKATVLQIRSIIPVLEEEGDLWPNRGFVLKLSDASHALYVSLSKHLNDIILSNKLMLGQFIYLHKLEDASPLPLLRALTPIPGRRPCLGTPQDIAPPPPFLDTNMLRSGAASAGSSDSESSYRRSPGPSYSPYQGRPRRRSWSESEILVVKEIFDSSVDSSVVKNEIKLPSRSASASMSPVHSSTYDSSDDNSSLVSRSPRVGVLGKRVVKNSTRSEVPATRVSNMQSSLHSLCNVVCDRKGAESRISWTSLPSNLVSHGKEVIRQRDIAVQAAADALQEACASERLLNSLSTMSQFPLSEGDDLQPFVDKFFNLQHDLAQTSLILQSLTSTSPFENQESESCTTSVKATMSVALERKKNANAWIKSAIALDLSPCLSPLITPPGPTKMSPSGRGTKPRGGGSCIVKRHSSDNTNFDNIPLLLALDKEEDDEANSRKGNTLQTAAELATLLQDECNKVLLIYVDKYLDEVDRKSTLAENDDNRIAGMMYKVKMVSDWLNSSVNKERNDGEGDEAEAYARARDKIYAILLKNVERTASVNFDRCKPSM